MNSHKLTERILIEKVKRKNRALFDLWGRKLISLQVAFTDEIMKNFERDYKTALKALRKDPAVIANDEAKKLEDVDKLFSDFLKKFVSYVSTAFWMWTDKQQQLEGIDEPWTTLWFSVPVPNAEIFAQQYAWEMITRIDESTRRRIRGVIAKGVSQGLWYWEIADELQKDYAFSRYRARLIASNELWTAYIQGKKKQFEQYQVSLDVVWFKKWRSHRDSVTSEWCLENDDQGWIPANQDFKSGHQEPPRFPWCRCDVDYRATDPR